MIELVGDFANERIAPHALHCDAEKYFSVDVLAGAGELGLGGIYVAEEFCGAGLTRQDAVLIFEELAKAAPALSAYISVHNMVVWMIGTFGNDEQRAQWVPQRPSVESLGSYCLIEPVAGSDAPALSTRALREGNEYVLNGVKQFISGAGSSAYYVVICRTGDTGNKGISTGRSRRHDWAFFWSK